jgi:GMP reductase
MVMIGSLFAGHEESPGRTVEVDGKLFKEYHGSASDLRKMREDVQSSISYAGGTRLVDIRKVNCAMLGGDDVGEHQ